MGIPATLTTRRIQQLRESLYLCIPRRYAIDAAIRKGDIVRVHVTPTGNLLIEPPRPEDQPDWLAPQNEEVPSS